MRILYYLFLGIGKIIGPIWFLLVAVHFRRKARNAVYNMVLKESKTHRLSRLWQREPEPFSDSWILTTVNSWERPVDGMVFRVDRSKVATWLWFWLVWIWLDDDSTCDTYDCRHNGWDGETESKPFNGGDTTVPQFNWYKALRWNMRNTTMNFKYYFGNY